MNWFLRKSKNISTSTAKSMPSGIWVKVPTNGELIHRRDLSSNFWVDPKSGYHFQIDSIKYFNILFDQQKYTLIGEDIHPKDVLSFVDTKKYTDRINNTIKKTPYSEAIQIAKGKMNEHTLIIGCMNFGFIGGSMGAVVGERIALAASTSLKHKIPLLLISQSGGARMMEGIFSLMQMAKTTMYLSILHEEKIPYISIMTHPTTGGVSASFAMLGDINIAEPGSLIGFAGPRIIEQTIGRVLPKGFQTAEYLLDHGFLDMIVPRPFMKQKLTSIIDWLYKR